MKVLPAASALGRRFSNFAKRGFLAQTICAIGETALYASIFSLQNRRVINIVTPGTLPKSKPMSFNNAARNAVPRS